jgi:hypothetical protein
MTPKEKAIELVDKFQKQIFFHVTNERLDINESKGLALIAVDEIINTEFQTVSKLLDVIKINKIRLVISLNKDYWQEVKQEIEKL